MNIKMINCLNQLSRHFNPHDILKKRFLKVGTGILTFKGKDCFVVVDYYSKYPELPPLPHKTATTITNTVRVCLHIMAFQLIFLVTICHFRVMSF